MPITTSSRALVDKAMAQVRTYTVPDVLARLGDGKTQLVDIRDIRELADGTAVGAFHAPRGMLEFWVDPASPYHRDVFAQDKEYVLFCAAGWRSALATKTLMDMGMERVAHVDGGFGVARPDEDAAFARDQGENVSRAHEILRRHVGVGQGPGAEATRIVDQLGVFTGGGDAVDADRSSPGWVTDIGRAWC